MMNIDQAIYNTAVSQGFSPTAAKFVAAQARFESADYTSNVFKMNNNTSGIKFIGQPNAVKGSISSEGDNYAKFNTVQDSINDKIVRLYNITMKGVTPAQLKASKNPDEFARLLKQRGYYGNGAYGTAQGESDINNYANGIRAKLLKINIIEFVEGNKKPLFLGVALLLIYGAYRIFNKNKVSLK